VTLKRWIRISFGVIGLALLLVVLGFWLAIRLPSDAVVKEKFLAENPTAEFVSTELIFEQDGISVHLVEFRDNGKQESGKSMLALRKVNIFQWVSCDDHGEVKCR